MPHRIADVRGEMIGEVTAVCKACDAMSDKARVQPALMTGTLCSADYHERSAAPETALVLVCHTGSSVMMLH